MSLLDIFVLLIGGLLGYYITSHFFATGQAA
jgi:hypothetical protein